MTATLNHPITDVGTAPTKIAARTVDVTKVYGHGEAEVRALDGVSIGFETGRFTAIMGPSGSGKSTLMHCLAGLDTPTSGSVFVGDTDVSKLNDRQLTQLRRDEIGFIFQAFNLVPTLTALENITLPSALAGRKPNREWLEYVIATVGLQTRLKHRPSELSGGQQQRVAVARALAAQAKIIFADEPTGNLDSRTGAEILEFMRTAVRQLRQTIVMVTHDPVAASYADRAVFLADGRIVDEIVAPTADDVLDRIKTLEVDAMFRLTIKELVAKKLRLLSTAMAVLLGVAFLAGTLILTDTATKSFDSVLADANANTAAYVRGASPLDLSFGEQRPRIDASLAASLRSVDGVAEVATRVNGYAQIVDKHGALIGDAANVPLLGANWVPVADLNPYQLADGQAPTAPDEIVIDKHSADLAGYRPGDRAKVLTTGVPRTYTVSGIATFGGADSAAGATQVLFQGATAQAVLAQPGQADGVAFLAKPGVTQRALATNLRKVVGDDLEVVTGAQLVAEDQAALHDNISSFSLFMLIFAGIAMFVGAFIINNTFSITVAQRTREMAMLRAIGAGRRQVMRAVILEAAVVGLVASALGLVAGVGVAALLQSMLASMGLDMPSGAPVIQTSTIVVAVVTGMVVTLVSATMPAWRASKVAPIAALRDVALDRSAGSKRRAVTGVVLGAVGVGALLAGLSGSGPALVGVGAVAVFFGVSVLGPVLARPAAWVLGAPMKLRGMSGSLARENAMRNPRRTARTAASLMIGVALVSFIMIFAASAKTSMAGSLEHDYRGTHIVDSGSFDGTAGISPDLAAKLRTTTGVETVAEQRVTKAEIDGSLVNPFSAFDASIGSLFDLGRVKGDLGDLGTDGIAVRAGTGRALGDTVTVTFPTGARQFVVRAVYPRGDEWVGSEFVGLGAFEASVPSQLDTRIYLSTTDQEALESASAAYPSANVLDKQGFIDEKNANIDMMLNLIYGMLGLAVLIALLGIANTLALSIHERKRELGLLRAVGMSKSQVRSSVRWESVIIAMFGTALGLAIGVFFGWAMVGALSDEGISVLTIPANGLVIVAAGAACAGVLAAIFPARRAARLDVLKAVAST